MGIAPDAHDDASTPGDLPPTPAAKATKRAVGEGASEDEAAVASSWVIRTPDQRVRVFISSTLDELAPERAAAREAITRLHLTPVLFDSGAHPHPPRDLYRAYLAQSAIFVGVYWQRYGWVAPGMAISGLEDEYRLAGDRPKLIYIKTPAPEREPRLQTLLDQVRAEELACYQRFSTTEELSELLQNDLALLLTEHFEQARPAPVAGASTPALRAPLSDLSGVSDLPAGTVTFLFTDIEGSTRLLQQLGDRYAETLGVHQQLLRAAFAAHEGHEVDTQGDSFFVAFARAPDAVTAAAQAQRALAEYAWPDGAAVRVRMGLHTGTPQLVGGHYVGLDVHRAARIAAAGHGGQVLLSDATRVLVEQPLPEIMALRDLGAHRLKDLQESEHLFQMVLPGLPSDFPPLKTLDRHAHNLPIQPTMLLGREEEVAAVCALLRRKDVRLVTLTGSGGVGKTRLGLQVAAELVNHLADGVRFVRLSRLADPALVLPTIAQTLGLHETGNQPIEEILREYVRTRHLLLLLDNFEQVVAAAKEVATLLESGPGLKMLITSRVVLHVRGEKEFAVPPLSLPSAAEAQHLPAPERLSQYAAVAMFFERAHDARPDFQLTDKTAPLVATICARLDGLPLAIELAAARVKVLSPAALLQRLERRLPLLTGGARDLDERQQTMRNTLAWSYDLLAPEEQRLFRRLAIFVGGCTLEAAEAMCTAPEGAEPLVIDVLDGMGTLVDQSLVQQREESDGTVRFSLLHVIREYALERLEASGEAEALRQAHATYFLALAEQAEPQLTGAQQAEWLRRLEHEHDNFRAALGWTGKHEQLEQGLRLAGALGRFWWMRGYLSEGWEWLEGLLTLDAASASTTRGNVTLRSARAKALDAAGALVAWKGDYSRAVALLDQSLAYAREVGDLGMAAHALNGLGMVAMWQGEQARAEALFEQSVAQARQGGVLGYVGIPLSNLGEVAYYQGDLERAAARYEEALPMLREAGNQTGTAVVLENLGNVARRQGSLERARALHREALTLTRDVGYPRRIAGSLEDLASTLGAEGQGERAARLLGAATALREAMGAPLPAIKQADIDTAITLARAALGEERWAAAFAAGHALSLDEAIAEALGETDGG